MKNSFICNDRYDRLFGLINSVNYAESWFKQYVFHIEISMQMDAFKTTRMQYQGMDLTVWIVRTIQDWQSTRFTVSDAEASLYAEKGSSSQPNPLYINAFSSSIITPSYSNENFWHVNVGMMNTWVKSGEGKRITARNYVNVLLESFVKNFPNSAHPPNTSSSPYLKVESGGLLVVECKNGIEGKVRPGVPNPFSYRYLEVVHGGIAKLIITP